MDGLGSNLKVLETSRRIRYFDGLLRLMGLILTLVAAILTGVDEETKTFPVFPRIKCNSIFIRSGISGSIGGGSDIERQDRNRSGGSRHDHNGVALLC
ncbi:hypothetical protein F3Y22_tig00110607pilonHSYRG00029 [Hibiscus syriacus]|uniref:CASP-like protein n=1 Tax=Hibiscus syriacus TaxID=106335 RepID=A0A6A3A3N5_HIBSY|nr:CASP-like protein 1E1 [Hibiscus syriacus]KAE8697902.1 hypothetical protein F3Y22_tig00110607pilonHSYRG00029 [Hibiscus syriacus]